MSDPSPSQPLLSTSRSSYGATSESSQSEKPSPEESASLFSIMTVSWMSPLFKTGYRRQLQEEDIYEILPERRAGLIGSQLQEHWDNERRKAVAEGRKPSLARALGWFILPHYWFGQVCIFISDIIGKLTPYIVLWIIVFLEDSQDESKSPPPAWHGYALGVLLFVSSVMLTGTAQYWVVRSSRTGNLVRTGLIDMIFRKSTVISSKDRLEYPDGKIFNLMSTDPGRIDSALEGLTLLAVVPFGCVVTVILLIRLMGPSAILGTFILMFVNPFQAWAMAKLHSVRMKASALTDRRIHVVTEILQGIKIIKFFTFEPSFAKKVSDIRTSELKFIAFLNQVRGIIYSFSSSLPVFASALSFVLYAALGNELTPRVIFPALTLFTGLRVPLLVLPYTYSEASDAWVSVKRIEQFLLTADTEPIPPIDTAYTYALSLKNASFYWDQVPSAASEESGNGNHDSEERPLLSDEEGEYTPEPFLKDITLDIPRGSLVAIVGPVGSGKSSLIQAMIGNMSKSQGEVVRGATIGYASQTHWIQNATIRNNILFDTPLDEERYWRVVKACCLEKDLSNMPYGDQTEIGERGVNLSGGQKARLSLARCVYYNAETVIMDDPLSAVDSHVGKSLWEDCVMKELSNKTRIIATHQLHVLKDVDYVICMSHGRISEQGTFQNLMADTNGHFRSLMKQYGGAQHGEDEEGEKIHRHRIVLKRNKSSGKVQLAKAAIESDDDETILSEVSEEEEEEDKPIALQSQMVEEERAFGAVSSKVYLDYMKLGGYGNWFIIVFLALLQQFIGVWMSVWLSYWTNDEYHLPLWTYINIYVGTGIIQLIVVMAGSLLMVVIIVKSSALMHDLTFIKVLYSPMSFFDTTPVGRILNRLSKDISTIDNTLMGALNSFMITTAGIISIFVLSSFFLPWITAILLPLTFIYFHIAAYFQCSNRELKRIDTILRSHLYSYFSEALSGMGTLKAFHPHGVKTAIERNRHNFDRSNKAYYHLTLAGRWVSSRSFAIGYTLNLAAVFLIVWTRFEMSPATAGLILSYLARLSSEMNWAIQCFSMVENNMNSSERLLYYIDNLEQEPPAEILDRKPESSWPGHGHVSFQDVSMRYREGLPLVLNKISFDIPAGYMVGVVGRTGAGKSSLIQALFRLVELESGKITIDGIVTSSIGTTDLRSKISIIPQDPVLFQGTLRYNLDPLSRHTEQELWKALETSGLKSYVQKQESGLDLAISANGENLSVGQRQLVCLSRALLIKTKVVVLDEATASVDLATDSLIQKAIRNDFSGSTVITIAHRLNTVIDYNRILVMDHGQVAEYDTPRNLLSDANSAFSKMVDETGAMNAALLRSLAGCK